MGRYQMGKSRLGIVGRADDFVVYYDAQSKDLEACLEKGEGDCLYTATTEVLMPRVVKSQDEIFSRWGYCDNHDLSRLDNQSIERDRLIGIGFVLNFVKFISFTFGDKKMISVIEAKLDYYNIAASEARWEADWISTYFSARWFGCDGCGQPVIATMAATGAVKVLAEGVVWRMVSSYVYEMPKKKKKSQSMDKGKDKDKEDDTVNMFFKKMEFISKDEPRLDAFVEKLKLLKKEVEADCPNPLSKNKTDNLEQLVGVAKPPVVNVNNPSVGTTKGRQKLRIKDGKEKAIEKSLKGMNSCSLCGGTDHNKRTCPRRFEGQEEVVVQKEVMSQVEVGQTVNFRSLKIVMENPNHLNEPNEAIPEVNPVVPEPNQVVDIHDPNEMVDIPDDIDLADYDKEDSEEDPEEDPEEDVDFELEDDANHEDEEVRCVAPRLLLLGLLPKAICYSELFNLESWGDLGTCQTEIALLKSKNKIGEKERELLNHDLENVEVFENKMFYLDMVRVGAVLKPPSDDEDTERPRKKSKNSTSDGNRGVLPEPRGTTSDLLVD
ncbi:hypothetical protein Tco_1005966 [Tanacetum coccineum]|uniref:Protein FAR1-RELATED SEQUENCE n=1 Tax=Tanacetum coccineum TaxID=301880 RepID=A0ABQ5FHN1_9ASTR